MAEPSWAEGQKWGELLLSGPYLAWVSWAGVGLDMVMGSLQVSSWEFVCRSCLKKTLHKLEGMMRILQAETAAGTGTPTAIADSILNITGVGACCSPDLPPPLPHLYPPSNLCPPPDLSLQPLPQPLCHLSPHQTSPQTGPLPPTFPHDPSPHFSA